MREIDKWAAVVASDKVPVVYFAGKVNRDDKTRDAWRASYGVDEDKLVGDMCIMPDGGDFIYGGPALHLDTTEDHGLPWSHSQDGTMIREMCENMIEAASFIVGRCTTGAYGTMWELGFAHAMRKPILADIVDSELWFADPESDAVPSMRMRLKMILWAWSKCRLLKSLAESPIERLFVQGMAETGAFMELLGLQSQKQIRQYRVDFIHEESKTIIEVDGATYHSNDAAFKKDRERDRLLTELGYAVLRFHGAEIRQDAKACAANAQTIIRKRCTSNSA